MLWQFSESNQPLLRKCLEAATFDGNNQWVQKFGCRTDNFQQNNAGLDTNPVIISDGENPNNNSAIECMEIDESPVFIPVKVKMEKEDFWREILELDPVDEFELIVEKCLKNTNLYIFLAEESPIVFIEKLCKHICETKDINSEFLENFYNIFFPVLLKREEKRESIDLLVKAKYHPIFFKKLLIIIVKDIALPEKFLHDFVSLFNETEKTEFITLLTQKDISKEVFIHHLSTIHLCYKNCKKNNEIQNYILSKLVEISEECVSEKIYGRFLLNFLQCHKDFCTNILSTVEKIVETHKSAFKKPCLNVLSEIKNTT